jgi:type IX secretion system PorP/SprF family membrane protein
MKKIVLHALFLTHYGLVCAQQLPQSSLYQINPFQWNVAAAGSDQSLVAHAGYRKQWSQLNGAPETQMVNMHLPFDRFKSGVGLRVQNDQIGAHSVTSATLGYSYHAIQTQKFRISLGLGIGIDQFQLDGQKLRAPDGVYEPGGLFTHRDDLLSEGVIKTAAWSLETGVWLQGNRLQVGISALPSLAQSYTYRVKKDVGIKRTAHFSVFGAYRLSLSPNFDLSPAIWVQTDGVKTQHNIATQLSFRQNLQIGLGTRGVASGLVESVTVTVGGRLNPNVMLFYAYDSVLSALQNTASGSHELVLRYTLPRQLGTGKLPPIIYNPRYL